MSICTSSEASFSMLRDIAAASLAVPASFALPVDAVDGQEFLTIEFRVGNNGDDVEVVADESAVTVRDRKGATRVCRLPCAVEASSVRTRFAAPLLSVLLRKKPAAFDLPSCAARPSSPSRVLSAA